MIFRRSPIDHAIRKRGRVLVRGELWTAEADESIPKGEKVKILKVRDLVLRVERDIDAAEKTK